MIKNKLLFSIMDFFKGYPEVELAYLFGSQATGVTGSLSDYDFAVYLDPKNGAKAMFDLKTEMISGISKIVGKDNVDLVVLNSSQNPELKYSIISKGKLLYKKGATKLLVEPRILNEYFDYKLSLSKYGLTDI